MRALCNWFQARRCVGRAQSLVPLDLQRRRMSVAGWRCGIHPNQCREYVVCSDSFKCVKHPSSHASTRRQQTHSLIHPPAFSIHQMIRIKPLTRLKI